MKSIKIAALIIGAIALFPAASFAENVSGSTQDANLESTTIGSGNVSVTESKQNILNLQKSGRYGTNVSGTAQRVNASTTTVGDSNVSVKQAIQNALSGQKAK